MMKNIFLIAMSIVIAIALSGCEDSETLFNPVNPDLAVSSVEGVPGSTQNLIVGANRQLSLAIDEVVVTTEIASDNYTNSQTFFNQFLDNLNIDPTDNDIEDIQFDIHRLRQLAISGRDDIAPLDESSTLEQIAEFNFLIGFSYLLFGENFSSVPAEIEGPAVPAATHLNFALTNFQAALDGSPSAEIATATNLGIARAHYRLGNRAEAVAASNAAIASDPAFVKFADFDATNGPFNTMQDALFDRGSFDDLQPLPRLDFLDPKYNGSDATSDFSVPILKIEEAHLIIIEAAISQGTLADAQQTMRDLIGLVATRPVATFDDSVEDRDQDFPSSRPDTAVVVVAASSADPARSGLVLDRKEGDVTVPTVSGTSVTVAMVDAIASAEEALEILYLMRQEIFIAEGRRMADLGIRFITADVEFQINTNITEADLVPVIPAFISNISSEIDAFDYDGAGGQATITHNLNRIIVDNRTSDLVAPFE